uniref:Uncharacterized protein n=1 Tax=candidate division CPR3 bacterium TaxID=2268181 RepID=A0A7V3N4U2_UNCC3
MEFTIEDIRKIIVDEAKWNRNFDRMLDVVEEFEDRGRNVWESFFAQVKEKINEALAELKKKGVDETRLRVESFDAMILIDFESFVREGKVSDSIVVYGETMGFVLLSGSKWEVFESSDEPGSLDKHLYENLILKDTGDGKIRLYGTHHSDFVDRWMTEGIPEGVYFANKKWIAERYWHPEGNDVLVRVDILRNAVMETSDLEYKTVRRVYPGEFTLRIIG